MSFLARTAGINGFQCFREALFALDDQMKLDLESIRSFIDNNGKTIFLFDFTSVVWANFLNGLKIAKTGLTLKTAFFYMAAAGKNSKMNAFLRTNSRLA